jgi:phosphatidylserine/phosphatidylglycerophosphate/cardiolipin synthase-like enzyme
MTNRIVQHSRGRFRNEPRELLQWFFSSEIVAPTGQLWIVSPWLRDVELFDNTTGSYSTLVSDSPRRVLRLTDVLRTLLLRGTRIVIAVRAPPRDDGGVCRMMEEIATAIDRVALVSIVEKAELHTKGLLGGHAALTGSMNLTHAGLERNTEMVNYISEPEQLGRLRLEFERAFGQ